MNTHPWTLWKAWLTFSPWQGKGEAFREGNQQAVSTDRRLAQVCSADSLPPRGQPLLGARLGAQVGC